MVTTLHNIIFSSVGGLGFTISPSINTKSCARSHCNSIYSVKRKKLHIQARTRRPRRPEAPDPTDHIIFQGFNWDSQAHYPWYEELKQKAPEIGAAGFTDCWFPPPTQSVDKHGYLPSLLYNLDKSNYGTAAQLKELIDAMHKHGVCCLADIVINHRSGFMQDKGGHWNVFEGGTTDRRLDWGAWAIVDNDCFDSAGQGKHDSGESYGAAPDLDHSSKQVQDELTDWMNWLKAEIGFDGWRFDFVKGYAPEYTKLYCERTLPTFAIGEYWTVCNYDYAGLSYDQNQHRQKLCNWIDGTDGWACAFDFTTKGILQEALQNNEYWRLIDPQGNAPGLIGWYPLKAVTFVDNHDTGSSQRHWMFPDDKVLLGYVYILTHPGIPCVFYDHYFFWGIKEQIDKLILLRKRNQINATSKLEIIAAYHDMYIATVNDRLTIKMGSRFDMGLFVPNPSAWNIVMIGQDFAVWENVCTLPPKNTPTVLVEGAN